MFTNNKFKQLDAVAEMIKGIADADAKVKMQEMRGIIAGHNRMEVPVAEKLDENAFDWKNKPSELPTKPGEKAGFDSKKVSTGTVYQKKWKKEPTQKDEAVDPTVTTTDTLAGRVSGGAPNQHSSFKVKLKAEEMEKEELVGKQHKLDKNKNGKLDSQDFKMLRKEEIEELDELSNKTMLSYRTKSIGRDSEFEKQGYKAAGKGPGNEKSDKLFNKADLVATARDSAKNKMLRKEEEELEEAKFDPLKHVKNPSPAVKTAAKDVKRSSYADRVAVMKAGGVKDDRGPRGVTQEEVEELDENFEAGSLVENYEMINEVSLGAKIKAYAHHHSNAFEHGDMGNDDEAEHHSDRADKIIKHIARHHGPEAVKHAEKAAHSAIFGRDDPHGHGDGGNDVLHGGLRGNQNDLSGLSKNTTKAGTIPKNTQKAMKNKIMAYGKHRNTGGPKGHLPEEVELDEGTMTHITLGKKVKNDEGGHDQDVHYKGKKIGSIDSYKHRTGLRYGGKHDATGDMDAGSRSPEEAIDFVRSSHAEHLKSMKEEVQELDEAKSNYELYHSQYSGAIHHALAHHASKAGLSVHDDDYHHHVSIGPRKPTEGVSVSHSLPATDEKGGKHMIHMQIYNRGGDKKPFELNTYSSKIAKTSGRTMKEDTELDERTLSPAEKDALEVNVKSMKKNLAGFKARYGKDAKSVMYATATKQAKKD